MGTKVSFKKLINRRKKSKLPQEIQISKENITNVNVKFG
jgi:hypothetical protein